MKKLPLFLALFVMMTSARAAMIFTDDFDGAMTANQSTNPNLIGPNWVIDTGTWQLTGAGTSPANFALRVNSVADNLINENAVQTLNTGGATFTLSTQIYLSSTSTFLGAAVNYIDNSNFILVRATTNNFQAYYLLNGTRTILFSDSITLLPASYYTMNITFDGTQYTGALTSTDGLTTYDSHSFTTSSLTNGYAALYSSNSARFFDNFSLAVVVPVPEPSSFSLLGASAVALFCLRRRSVIKSRFS